MSFIEVSSGVRERSVPLIMGQVLSLVAAALGICALTTYLGRDLAFGTARIISFVGFGMLIAQSFVAPLRRGSLGILWLGLIASAIGYGLGPFIAGYVDTNPSAVTTAGAPFARAKPYAMNAAPCSCRVRMKRICGVLRSSSRIARF